MDETEGEGKQVSTLVRVFAILKQYGGGATIRSLRPVSSEKQPIAIRRGSPKAQAPPDRPPFRSLKWFEAWQC